MSSSDCQPKSWISCRFTTDTIAGASAGLSTVFVAAPTSTFSSFSRSNCAMSAVDVAGDTDDAGVTDVAGGADVESVGGSGVAGDGGSAARTPEPRASTKEQTKNGRTVPPSRAAVHIAARLGTATIFPRKQVRSVA